LKVSKKLRKHLVHLGTHFLITFILAVYWAIYGFVNHLSLIEIAIGFLLIMFAGSLIDGDHYWGNWERVLQVIKGAKEGTFDIGKSKVEKINYLHTWKFFVFFTIFSFLIFLFWNKSLAVLIYLAYLIHMFAIDSFNNELNWCHTNPMPADIYNFLYSKSKFFRKRCWGNREKQEED